MISSSFATPFYTGGESVATDTGTMPVAINGREFLVDLTTNRYSRTPVKVLRTRSNNQPNENLLLEPEVWRTTFDSWHLGAGQRRKDHSDSEPYRFWASKNIDPWERWGISLLPETSAAYTATAGSVLLVVNGTLVVVRIGSTAVNWFTTLTYPLSGSSGTLPANSVSATTDGQLLYVLCSDNKVYSVDLSTWNGSATPPTKATLSGAGSLVAYIKGFIVAAVGATLYNISSGTPTTIYAHPLSTHTWVDATDGLSSAYLIGGQGDRWAVYRTTVKDDGTTLNPCAMAAPLPDGEVGYSLGSYLGYVLIGTDTGARFASPSGDGSLVYGPLIETGSPVRSFEGQGRFVWFGIGGHARDDETSLKQPEAGLARLDLSTFTSPLTPAFAADLVARSSGSDVSGVGQSVVTFKGKRVFTSAAGVVYAETASPAMSGWLIEGDVNQNVWDEKVGLYANIACDPLPSDTSISMLGSTDGEAEQTIGSITASGANTSSNLDLNGIRWSDLTIRYLLEREATATTSPRLVRAELRSIPRIGEATEWTLPLMIQQATNWRGAPSHASIGEVVEELVSLSMTGRQFWFREGTRTYRCFCSDYEWLPTSSVDGSVDFQGIMVLKVRRVR